MPIYEFKCLKCNDIFEMLLVNSGDRAEMACPKCSSENFERVISTTNYAMGASGASKAVPQAQTRSCASGNCTTIDLPGHSR